MLGPINFDKKLLPPIDDVSTTFSTRFVAGIRIVGAKRVVF